MKANQVEWEKVYSDDSIFHKNEFPSELIIQFVRRNYTSKIVPENRGGVKALDIGCGWGNNLKFVKQDGFDVFGIDFSVSAIESLKSNFGDKVVVGDISNMPFENKYFEFCFDKSAIQHNIKEDIPKIHEEIFRILKPNGKFFSTMLVEGSNGFITGYLNEEELKDSLKKFKEIKIDYITRTENNGRDKLTAYIIEATK